MVVSGENTPQNATALPAFLPVTVGAHGPGMALVALSVVSAGTWESQKMCKSQ